jgi:hypothetical protein
MNTPVVNGRRSFLKSVAVLGTGVAGFSMLPSAGFAAASAVAATDADLTITDPDKDLSIIGPKEGYSPQIGTLVSMMAFMRWQVLNSVKGLTTEQLDFLLDAKANRIGAMLNHLAATDALYHEHVFKGVEWGKWDSSVQQKWGVAMALGDPAREAIKGNNLDYYTNLLSETRESTLAELRKRDDKWLMSVDQQWPWGPTNIYCKLFHVCEHEGNHNGQIKLVKGRIPGMKTGE